MKILLALVSTLFSTLALAGTMNVALDCKSASGKTVLAADVQGDDPDASITLTFNGKKVSFINEGAQKLIDGDEPNIRTRVEGGEIFKTVITTSEQKRENKTRSVYSVTGLSPLGFRVFSLVSKGPLKLKIDKAYGYRKGNFLAKLTSKNPLDLTKKLVADLICTYDYAP